MRYFDNRALAQKLGLNLAKWKRWSREFLPPDPLGGLQSGFARQYHPDQAFTVFLGGHLVGTLKFSVPEARRILADLEVWLAENGFRFQAAEHLRERAALDGVHYLVYIARKNARGLGYLVRGVFARDLAALSGVPMVAERFTESALTPEGRSFDLLRATDVRLLNVSGILKEFTAALNLDPVHFQALG